MKTYQFEIEFWGGKTIYRDVVAESQKEAKADLWDFVLTDAQKDNIESTECLNGDD